MELTKLTILDLTISELTREISADSPAPGGGSVAALCGTLATALCQMVANLTVGNKKYSNAGPEMETILKRSKDLEKQLTQLIDEDTRAYLKVIEAYRMPKQTNSDKVSRTKAIDSALKGAAQIPFQTLTLVASTIDLIELIVRVGNPNCITDAGVAAELISTAARGAAYNVAINLGAIKDKSFVAKTKVQVIQSLNQTIEKTRQIRRTVSQAIEMEAEFI